MAKHEKLIKDTMFKLQKATARDIGAVLHGKGIVSSVASGDATCRKVLKDLMIAGKIRKEGSCFMLQHLSGWGEHDRRLTKAGVEFVKRWECVIYREHSIKEVKLRPDALILVRHQGKKACVVLEVMNTEKEEYLKQKLDVWASWKDSLTYLADLFEEEVGCFDLVTAEKNFEGIWELQDYIKHLETT